MSDSLREGLGTLLDGFTDLGQCRQISGLQQDVARLKKSARSWADTDPIRAQLDELRAANGELRLYVATLFRVLETKGIIGRDDLAKLVEQIDQADGRRDNALDGDALRPISST
jgi:hypothetical protein